MTISACHHDSIWCLPWTKVKLWRVSCCAGAMTWILLLWSFEMFYRKLPAIIQPPSGFWIKKKNIYNLPQQSDNGCWCEYTPVKFFSKHFNLQKIKKFISLLSKCRLKCFTSCPFNFFKIKRKIMLFWNCQFLIF